MNETSTKDLRREDISRTLIVYLRDKIKDRDATIGEKDNLDKIFGKASDISLRKNAVALEFADFVSKTYNLPLNEVTSYDPYELNVGEASLLIYDKINRGKRK